MHRREFLKANIALAGAGLLSACQNRYSSISSATGRTPSHTFDRLGAQLYSVRDLFKHDFETTLKLIHDIGFRDLEFAGYYDHSPREIRSYMNRIGLVSNSVHIRIEDVRENFDQVIETATIMGQSNLVIAYLPESDRTYDGYLRLAELFNVRGEQAKKAGLRLAYHNHDFEFQTVGDRVAYDILLEETDPDLFFMEIDLYWTHIANIDPVNLFKRAPNRFISCHLKDSSLDGNIVSVGQGVIDFTKILAAAQTTGIKYFYVEHDNSPTPFVSLTKSYEFLNM